MRVCPNCHLQSVQLVRNDSWGSLFFIPVVKIKSGQPYLHCSACGATIPYFEGPGEFEYEKEAAQKQKKKRSIFHRKGKDEVEPEYQQQQGGGGSGMHAPQQQQQYNPYDTQIYQQHFQQQQEYYQQQHGGEYNRYDTQQHSSTATHPGSDSNIEDTYHQGYLQ
ncbi:hypothetical protein SAMD00019534_126290 [Acytostelium subglobosum LB1]|uniref:hypothetical protein n=1 Tax=Acytostelium subglobosum LB1 TaxID=1410327 RepID=UPI000644BC17|nr:hypothetical protein SAMD00019534_126290 [Acytostelium subglobosum LB1]GAM29453.1 hypothetical protein SAMD00019534_126290 [Acytostelium subglobosum LB1]|eukprot:XP_012747598.1 hypothetical protein SAMD00019534_126290 [Acytostelium subglobosum LB1]